MVLFYIFDSMDVKYLFCMPRLFKNVQELRCVCLVWMKAGRLGRGSLGVSRCICKWKLPPAGEVLAGLWLWQGFGLLHRCRHFKLYKRVLIPKILSSPGSKGNHSNTQSYSKTDLQFLKSRYSKANDLE